CVVGSAEVIEIWLDGRAKGNCRSFACGSATVWIVKGGLMEKRKTMVQFSAFPQPRLRLLTS
ncbi:MAG: hypothetical protein WBS19_12215, partial [Candidatus Korobacteraceae bacterium]